MGSKKPLYQVPLPSTEFAGDASLCGHVLRFEYHRDGALSKRDSIQQDASKPDPCGKVLQGVAC